MVTLGLAQLERWEQVPDFEPSNVNQLVIQDHTGIPGAYTSGGYSSFFFNRIEPGGTSLYGATDDRRPLRAFLAGAAVAGFFTWLFAGSCKRR